MMTIGEFAQLTGLTPKALRHYDATGLLSPASVDPRSGYRGYDLAQLRQAVLITVLRAAEVPLARISTALADEDPAGVLSAERARIAEQRATQDAALDAADWLLAQRGMTRVVRQQLPEIRFAYADLPGEPELPEDASAAERAARDEADTELANGVFARIYTAVRATGGEIAGPWWFQHLPVGGDESEPMTLRCAWPVTGDLGEVAPGELTAGVFLGTLPAGEELSVEIPHGMTPPEVTIPPGQLALFEAVSAEIGDAATLEGLRTEGRLDAAGQPIGLTLRFALPPRS